MSGRTILTKEGSHISHVAEIEVEITDLDALRVAVERCGGEFMLGQTTHAWWGTFLNDSRGMANSAARAGRDPDTFGTCVHAIRLKGKPGKNGSAGPWEIGVCTKGDGFSLVYDNYGSAGRQLESVFGKDLLRLVDELSAEIAMRELAREGYRLSRMDAADGSIVLECDL